MMDSNRDLPSNWTEKSYEDLLKKKHDNVDAADADLVSSDDGATSEEVKYFLFYQDAVFHLIHFCWWLLELKHS